MNADAPAGTAQFSAVPAALRTKPQWLLWKSEPNGDKKPRKVPYYLSGKRRMGVQGDADDRAALAPFEAVCEKLSSGHYTGIGFAFLPGDGLIGIDIDNAIDLETGSISARALAIIEACASYTEYSVSRKGMHILVAHDFDDEKQATFKSNDIGLEVFCGRQYFTVSGCPFPGTPADVANIDARLLERLRKTVDQAKKQRSVAPVAARADLPIDARAKVESALAFVSPDGGYHEWIEIGMAIHAELGDGAFSTWNAWSSRGTSYPGERILEQHWKSFKPGGGITGATIFKRAMESGWRSPRPHLVKAVDRDVPFDGSDDPPTLPPEELAETEAPPPAPTGARGRAAKPAKPIKWERYRELMDHFVLIYSTPTCFDLRTRLVLQVNHLRLAFGSDYVKMWLGSDERKMILPSHLVFSPGTDCQFPEINLFDGMPIVPSAGDCAPILELIRHLCADSASTPDGVDAVVQWVLSWVALPLQKLGTKMQSAMIFHGPEGAGKNLFWEIVGRIYGRYAIVVGQKQLESDFNDWASQKMLVIGDEVVTRQELYHHKGDLKKFITGETIQINPKGLPLREENNRCNVIFLSNEQQPLALGDGDRRYFVVYTPHRRHDDLYQRVGKWAAAGGIAAFYHYLQNLDLTGFSQYDIPPMTKAKQDLIELGLKPEERFVREWLAGYLPLPLMPCSNVQLYRAFRRWCMACGERFPPAQEAFSKATNKAVGSMANKVSQAKGRKVTLLEYKVINLCDPVNGQRSVRMWKPEGCQPPEGLTEGKWAAGCVIDFEEYLGKYMAMLGGGEKS